MAAKKVKVSNVPNLRFPGFEGEWETKRLGDITTWSSGGTPPKDNPLFWNGDIPWISASSMRGLLYSDSELKLTQAGLKKGSKLATKGTLLLLVRGSMLFNKIPIGVVSKDVAFNQDVKSIVVSDCSTSEYILSWFTASEPKILNMVTGTGIGAGKLDLQELKGLKIKIPPLHEQQKITAFLSLINERIDTQSKIIQRLKSLIKATIQILVKGNRPNWKKQYLNEILTEREETNIDNNTIHSVSVSKGVVNQIEYLGRSFAAKDTSNYNVVCYGDIIYTKSPTGSFPYGIIKQSYIPYKVAVSPLYGVFIPKNVHLATILHHYFDNPVNTSNYLYSLVQKGAKNTINITNQNFLNKQIFLPTDEKEIALMANLLHNIMDKINLEQSLINKLSDQKKYLLQHLFI